MSRAIKCDRCGEFSDHFGHSIKSPNGSWNIDICTACYESYINWIKEGKVKVSEDPNKGN